MNILIAFLILIYSMVAYAEPKMYIFFINGVNTTADDANINMEKLEDLMNYDSPTITWNVLYNATHGLIKSDVWDYMHQKKQSERKLSIDSYTNYYIIKNNIDCCISLEQYENVKQSIKLQYLNDKRYVGMNLGDIVNQFNNKFKGDKKNVYILIIAHSQGNSYANQLYDYLVNGEHFPFDHVAIFSIASPAHSVDSFVNPYTRFKYVTADNDHVINAVRLLPGDKPMPANVHLNDCKDLACHSLVNSYLFDKVVSSDICKGIKSYISLWLNETPLC